MQDIGQAALDSFKRFGRPILPIQEGAKFPPKMKWKEVDEEGHTNYVGLDTEDAILNWWAHSPRDNYAIITGGNLVVVDIDTKTEPNGFVAMAELPWDQETFVVRTPSKGEHLYYDTKGEGVRTFRSFKSSVDIKGVGGYVLGPGSVLPYGEYPGNYEITDDVEMLPAPEKLLDNDWLSACATETLLKASLGKREASGRDRYDEAELWADVWRVLQTDHLKRGKSFGHVELPQFGESQRHDALLRCLGWLRNQEWSDFDQWKDAMAWVADSITSPSLRQSAPDEFIHLVNDIWAKEAEPEPFDFYQNKGVAQAVALESMLSRNPLARVMQFAPDYETQDELSYLVQDLVPFGSITAIAALFKTGKSEFVASMVRAVTTGTEFLGRKTEKCDVLYLTEERQGSFQVKADRYEFGYEVGIVHRSALLVEADLTWENAMELATELCALKGFRVLIVDTFTRWSNLTDENSNAEITKRMTPLEKVAGAGVAVVVVHQHGKSTERSHGLSMRGASAFGDGVDVFIELYRVKGKPIGDPERLMTLTGRVVSELSWTISFDHDFGYYFVSDDTNNPRPTASGGKREARFDEIRILLDIRGEISANTLVADTDMSRPTASKYLKEMFLRGEVIKETRDKETWYMRPTGQETDPEGDPE